MGGRKRRQPGSCNFRVFQPVKDCQESKAAKEVEGELELARAGYL